MQPADTSLTVGETTTFVVSVNTSVAATYSGTLSLVNNDADEAPFDFTISAQVTDPPPLLDPIIIDNGDTPGFGTSGSWSPYSRQGFQDDIHYSAKGDGWDVATWTFTDLPAGVYNVSATWNALSNRATDAPYSMDGGAVIRINQRVSPGTYPGAIVDQGVYWAPLGDPLDFAGGDLIVTLSDVQIIISDLSPGLLGLASESTQTIWLDDNAAGYGWQSQVSGVRDQVSGDGYGQSGVDLMTVVSHEMGHLLGLPDLDPLKHPHALMAGELTTGVRSLPTGDHLALEAGLSARHSADLVVDRLFRGLGDPFGADPLDRLVLGSLGSITSDDDRTDDPDRDDRLASATRSSALADDWLGALIDERRQPLRPRKVQTDELFAELGNVEDETPVDEKLDSNRRFLGCFA